MPSLTSLHFNSTLSFYTAALIFILQTITSMLASNNYVVVFALDVSKAFNSIRHATFLTSVPVLTYQILSTTGLRNFWSYSLHSLFNNQLSDFLDISASIVQASVVGPTSYVVKALDLCSISSLNVVSMLTILTLLFQLEIAYLPSRNPEYEAMGQHQQLQTQPYQISWNFIC